MHEARLLLPTHLHNGVHKGGGVQLYVIFLFNKTIAEEVVSNCNYCDIYS
jgi:hypothetical protein